MDKQLSIIVPVYNMEEGNKLSFCINSLLRQTIPEDSYEIIAVDDHSDDRSFLILQEYEKKYPGRVRAFRLKENHHQGGAKNQGLSQAVGAWIGFLDADDWVSPDFCEKLLKKGEETGADIVGCDYCLVDRHTFETGKRVPNNRPDQCGLLDHDKYASLILDAGSLVVKIYRRKILFPEGESGSSVFPEDIFYEDNAVSNTWMLRARRFAYLPEPLYYYYQHDASTVHTISLKRMEDRMAAARLLLAEAKKEGYFEEYREEVEYQFTTLFYINTLFSVMPAHFHVKGAYRFARKLCLEMKKTFPTFQKNRYYRERTPVEEKKLIALQVKSHLLFFLYYRALWGYRDLRKKWAKAG